MSRTYRKLVGGRVPDGTVHRFKFMISERLNLDPMPIATKRCFDDEPKNRCDYAHSFEKRALVPIEIMRSELELWEFERLHPLN